MQLAMCLFCAIANYVWIQQAGKQRYYLALDVYVEGNWQNAGAQICLTFLTFWILLSYLVPISLFVTLEIVKFVQVHAASARERCAFCSCCLLLLAAALLANLVAEAGCCYPAGLWLHQL